ncbi:MAG: glycine-rich protein [Verrucomicrobiota bacterium]
MTVTTVSLAQSGYVTPGGLDLDQVFQQRGPNHPQANPTGFTVNGVDLSARYFPLSGGGASAAATGFTTATGADLNTFFAAKGSVFPDKAVFNWVDSDQNWTVPAGVTLLRIKLWGGGGASNGIWRAFNSKQNWGGGGGFAQMDVAVTPGQVLTIKVARGGIRAYGNNWPPVYPAGGRSHSANHSAGGGRSQVILPGIVLIAGGGGSGGWNYYAYGGAGGGEVGGAGGNGTWYLGNTDPQYISIGGQGGTQSAGGAGGQGTIMGTPGGYLTGGNNQGTFTGPGGGDGYYGGGSGAESASATSASGGGGGSNAVIGGTNPISLQANGRETAAKNDPDYISGIADGALAQDGDWLGLDGGHGLVVIQYLAL